MPIYDYECPKCGNVFEKMVKSGEVGQHCPKCDTPADKKVSAPSQFNLKGDGFYSGAKYARFED